MLNIYFGNIKNGRLLRMPYFGHYILLIALMMVFMIGTAVMIGVGEQMMGGDIQQAQEKLRAWFTLPFMIIFGAIMIALVFAGANIAAKRIRDMGLPGWWIVLLFFIVSGGITVVTESQGQGGGTVGLLFLLALLFIPSNTFGKSKNI